jgi:hypothetical protein
MIDEYLQKISRYILEIGIDKTSNIILEGFE